MTDRSVLAVIPSGTLVPGEQPPTPSFVDGPVDLAALGRLGIAAEPRTAASVEVRFADGGLRGQLTHTRWLLRSTDGGGAGGEPYRLKSQAPWRAEVRYQSLRAPASWRAVLYARKPGGGEDIVGVSDGARLVLGVPLLDVLGSQMAWPAFDDRYHAVDSPTVSPAIERWLIEILREHALRGGVPWLAIERWPADAKWALTVRHDYDRLLTDAQIRALLRLYERLGIRSTWYLLRDRTIGHQARLLRMHGHEVALHTTAWNASEFQDEVMRLKTETGLPIRGLTAHGGEGGGFLGDRHIEWACAAGMVHGETIGRMSGLPYLAHHASPGGVKPTGLVLMPTHRSLDAGTAPDKHYLARTLEVQRQTSDDGDHLVLMNHPDVHRAELLEVLERAPLRSAWRCTAQEMADWTLAAKYSSQWQLDPEYASGSPSSSRGRLRPRSSHRLVK